MKKHSMAEAFRKRIALSGQRAVEITNLLKKEKFDESDNLRATILFQKAAYLSGCEEQYKQLITHVRLMGNEALIAKSQSFANKLNC